MDINQRNLEVLLGLTEVVMIRLQLEEWANEKELVALTNIITRNPLPDNWSSFQSEVARTSPGFQEWLRRLSRGKWQPSEAEVKAKIANIDFELPWRARLR